MATVRDLALTFQMEAEQIREILETVQDNWTELGVSDLVEDDQGQIHPDAVIEVRDNPRLYRKA